MNIGAQFTYGIFITIEKIQIKYFGNEKCDFYVTHSQKYLEQKQL